MAADGVVGVTEDADDPGRDIRHRVSERPATGPASDVAGLDECRSWTRKPMLRWPADRPPKRSWLSHSRQLSTGCQLVSNVAGIE